jgi:ribose 1,5-bisphosphokinase PhnN
VAVFAINAPLAAGILVMAAHDSRGVVRRIRAANEVILSTNGQTIADNGNPRRRAKLEDALASLEREGLMERTSGDVLTVTGKGYEYAEKIDPKLSELVEAKP